MRYKQKVQAPIRAANGTWVCFIIILLFTQLCPAANGLSTEKYRIYQKEYEVDWSHGFQEGLGEVEVKGKWGFINATGQIVIKPGFNQAFGFVEGIATVRSGAILNWRKATFLRLGGRWRHINKNGCPAYKKRGDFYVFKGFSEGLAPVVILGKSTGFFTQEEKWGFIDTSGEIVIPAKYEEVGYFSEGLASFKDPKGQSGYVNTKGEVVIEHSYDYAHAFSEGLAVVGMANGGYKAKFGFINKSGKLVIPLQYDSASEYSEGLARVEKNNKWGFINKHNDLVVPMQYDYVGSYCHGFAIVKKNDKLGYINRSGCLTIPFEFDDTESFSEGYAAVMVGRKWGYINEKGIFVIEPKFDLAGQFTEGFAKVAVGDKMGYIDKQGKYIWEPTR